MAEGDGPEHTETDKTRLTIPEHLSSPRRPGAASGSARLLALLVLGLAVGQVSALALTDSPPYAVYQHLRDPAEWRAYWWAWVGLLLQGVACAAALRAVPWWQGVVRLGRGLGPMRGVLVLALIAFSVAVPRVSVERFGIEVAWSMGILLLSVLNLCLAVAVIPEAALDRITQVVASRITWSGDPVVPARWDRYVAPVGAGWVLVACAGIAWFVFDGVPHIDDSVAYLFQAKTFASGRLSAPTPSDPGGVAVTHLVVAGEQWFSKFFPGWPVLLAGGVRLGVPWLVNPVLAALTVLVVHGLVRRVSSRGAANITVLLLSVSPWFLFMSGEQMSHPAALLAGVTALWCLDLQRGRTLGWPALACGAALGSLYLIRPFDAALLGLAAGLWGWGLFGQRLSVPALATICVTSLAVAALSLPYNAALTGDPLLTPHHQWAEVLFGPRSDVFGFGRDIGIPLWRNADPLPGHGAPDVILNANKNFFLLHTDLLGWLCGSTILAVLGLVRRTARADRFLLLVIAIVVGCHSFYWAPGGPDLGARYWYLVLVPLLVFTVRGMQFLAGLFSPGRVGAAVAVATVGSLMIFTPWRAVTKYHRYRDIGDDVRGFRPGRPALVFVRATARSDYQAAFNFNVPTLSGPSPVFVIDAGAAHRGKVLEAYPDRDVWVVGRPSPADSRLTSWQGPLSPGLDPGGAGSTAEASLQAIIPRPMSRAATR